MSAADELQVPRVAAAFDVLIKEVRQGERDLEAAISERDGAQEAMSRAYYLVTGRSPEWSNRFGYDEALEEIGDALWLLRQAK